MTKENQDNGPENGDAASLAQNFLWLSEMSSRTREDITQKALTVGAYIYERSESRLPADHRTVAITTYYAENVKSWLNDMRLEYSQQGEGIESDVWNANKDIEIEAREVAGTMPKVAASIEDTQPWEVFDPDLEAVFRALRGLKQPEIKRTFIEVYEPLVVASVLAHLLNGKSKLGKLVDSFLEESR